jgi:hypothetical protein
MVWFIHEYVYQITLAAGLFDVWVLVLRELKNSSENPIFEPKKQGVQLT